MGRDWYWGSSKSSKRDGGRSGGGGDDGGTSVATGCMCAVFQLFDFHQFQFANLQQQSSFKPNSFIPEEVDLSKVSGIKAPRNSFELEKTKSLPLVVEEDDKLAIPMGIQVKTNVDSRSKDCSSSDISLSPSAKTPNLVARLMGLDVLPDIYSPRSSSSSNLGAANSEGNKSDLHLHFGPRQPLQNKSVSPRTSCDHFTGCRSLPETPRISSSARKSDVDHHHRLSLQIDKENLSASEEELVMSRIRKELKAADENRSPAHYARQIVKQVKESVGRKVGSDITNTVKNREKRSRDELVSQLKSKKLSKALIKVAADESSSGKQSISCSPKLKVLEHKTKVEISSLYKNTNASTKQQRASKKGTEERFGTSPLKLRKHPQTSHNMRNKQEEPFVRPTTANISDKKCKRTPLSNDLLNVVAVSNLLPVKKDRIPQKQVSYAQESKSSSQLSSCSSRSYKPQRVTQMLDSRDGITNYDNHNGAGDSTTTTSGGDIVASEYREYITRIVRCTGIDKDTPLSFLTWFSPSHPLDPSTFHHLESFTTATTNHLASCDRLDQRCNRKLLFHLVDEILVDILRPYINLKPWTSSVRHDHGRMTKGSHLVDELCSKVGSFPQANCQVLEDIDAIIDKDLPQLKLQNDTAFDHEGEGIVWEIEKDLLDTLVHETASMLLYG
ncbi:hypothetical protein K2173_008666 [Erythroxylum novogranatense]|uniref:DUF4378 domain-containing protein n=1 Tax=Erythroxylum novogranatense TaxID=1862640 RepID=A0AAV8SKX7_9ROSI|nr:hypothetical protein K2173_008666 [Erythroxylum novogranatense]